jgi:predicted transcriptional regulator
MDKVAADYITGKKDYTQELDTFTEDLSNALKQTDKVTKNIISKLQAMNKYLLKLPEKE